MRLIVRTDAESDIASAYAWYEKQRKGLGAEFIAETSRTIQAIEEGTTRFPLSHRSVRRALVRRFPYGVFFVTTRTSIVVIAVMHLARHPRRVRTRALE